MTMNLPTILELMERIKVKGCSVKYHHSRAILNHLNKPVLAYGLGYGGFVFGFLDGHGFVKWGGYSAKCMHLMRRTWSETEASFYTLPKSEVLKQINENDLIVEKAINEEAIREAEAKQRFKRPLLGTIIYHFDKSWNPYRRYDFYRLKNGSTRIEVSHGDTLKEIEMDAERHYVDPTNFLRTMQEIRKGKNRYGEKFNSKKISNDLPEIELQRIEMQVAAKAI